MDSLREGDAGLSHDPADSLEGVGVDVKSMCTVAFESEEQAETHRLAEEIGGQMLAGRILTEATTSNCEDLVNAARDGHKQLVFELLQRHANINSTRSGFKATAALHEAVKHAHLDVVNLLLHAKADVELPTNDKRQYRALHYAALAGSLPCVSKLLAFRADAAATTVDGQTAMCLATAHPDVASVLHDALQLTIDGLRMRS